MQHAADDERAFIHDTTQRAHSNAGHTFGDHVTRQERRRSVLECHETL
jgi:hypothetical protein